MTSLFLTHTVLPQVPFELLVRRQIARLLEPSLQCARFIYDELVKVMLKLEPLCIPTFF
jgi:dynamin 1-like protein